MNNDEISNMHARVEKIISEFKEIYIENINEFNIEISYKEYGIGGKHLHRGYYCPSLIADIVTGNASRGRITKNIPNRKDFIYGFDREKILIFVQSSKLCEYISHREQCEIGVGVFNNKEIEFVSECQFNGEQIESYIFCLYDPYSDCVTEITKEKYSYSENEMQVDWFRAFKPKDV